MSTAKHSTDGKAAAKALSEWPLWEVFIRSKQGLEHKHCGSLHASDAQHALQMDPASDKIYRHPTFYEIPDEVGHM